MGWGLNMKRMTDQKLNCLVGEARKYLAEFPINWTMVGEAHVVAEDGRMDYEVYEDDTVLQIEWVIPGTDSKIILTDVYWNKDTGAILQAGTQFGDLVA